MYYKKLEGKIVDALVIRKDAARWFTGKLSVLGAGQLAVGDITFPQWTVLEMMAVHPHE